jgi:hypothetical protein
MVVCCHQHPPKYNRQSLPPGQKEDSMDSHEIIMIALQTQGKTIERHNMLTVKERKKSTKRKK